MSNYKCKITVLKKECYVNMQQEYLIDPNVGSCSVFEEGQEIIIDESNYESMNNGEFCVYAWEVINRYVYLAMHGKPIGSGWIKDSRVTVRCCPDGMRPVIFKIESIAEE